MLSRKFKKLIPYCSDADLVTVTYTHLYTVSYKGINNIEISKNLLYYARKSNREYKNLLDLKQKKTENEIQNSNANKRK